MIKSPITFFALIGLYPIIFLISKNWFIYETEQLLFLLVIPIITCVLGIVITFLIKKSVLIFLVGLCLFYLSLEKTITASNINPLVLIIAVTTALYMIKKKGFYFINLVLLIMTLLALADIIYSINTKSIKSVYFLSTLNKESDDRIKLKTTPNIYLIHLESYHSPTAMKRLYNFENQEFIKELQSKDFFVSKNNFSNYYITSQSLTGMFLEQHHYYHHAAGLLDSIGARDVIGGKIYNPTLSILKNNGYKIAYFQITTYNFTPNSYLDFYYPPSKIYDSLLIFQSQKFNQLHTQLSNLQYPNKRTDLAHAGYNEYYQILHTAIDSAQESPRPTFFFIQEPLEMGHSPLSNEYDWRQSDGEWVGKYVQEVKNSNPKILNTVDRIIEKDPNAIIILYGDHGAVKYRDIWTNRGDKSIEEIIYERKKISMEDLGLDLFGVFTAIRFPNGDPSFFDGKTYVNLFRMLFSKLSGDNPPIPNQEDASFLNASGKIYKIMVNGKALEKAEFIK